MLRRSLADLPIHAAMAGSVAIDGGARIANDPIWVWGECVELSHVPTACFEVLLAAGWQRVKRRRWVFPLNVVAGVHVSPDGNDEHGDGSLYRPFGTINRAIHDGVGRPISTNVILRSGVYRGHGTTVHIGGEYVRLVGPYYGRDPAILCRYSFEVRHGGTLCLG